MPPSVDLRHCLELIHHRSASSPWPYRTVSRVPWPMWDIDTLRWWQRDTNQSKTQALNAQRITWCSDIMVMWSLVHLYCPAAFCLWHFFYTLMLSSHCSILALIFTRRQVLWLRQMPEIRGKSVLVHTSDNHAVWIIKDVIWESRRCDENITHAKYLHRRWPTANERARCRAARSSGRTLYYYYY